MTSVSTTTTIPLSRKPSLSRQHRARSAQPTVQAAEASEDSANILLSAAQERELARRIHQGDRQALDSLVLANLRLVTALARSHRDRGVPLEDIKQEGIRGLMRAAASFDPDTHSSRFASYASTWIRHAMRRAVEANGSLIRLPEYVHKLRSRYRRTLREIHDGAPVKSDIVTSAVDANSNTNASTTSASAIPSPGTDPDIASRMGISLHVLDLVRRSELERAHLTRETDEDDGHSISFEETVPDRGEPLFDLESHEELECLYEGISRLKPQEAWLIRLRFGFGFGPDGGTSGRTAPRSAKTIARLYGLSLERLERTEQNALRSLKQHLRKRLGDEDDEA